MDADTILYTHSYYKASIDRAISIVRDYVIEHKLILTGGTAIDLALRTRGAHIYDDDTLPDYDAISDDNVGHAQRLAAILCNDGLEDINVINAFHITTVRVRFKRVPLFDSTYVPTDIISKIPYLDVPSQIDKQRVSFRVIHPNYQKIDQRLSLSNLMQTTGATLNIFNRINKDIDRNKLLVQYFDLPRPTPKITTTKVDIPIDLVQVEDDMIIRVDTELGPVHQVSAKLCAYGFIGYALLNMRYLEVCSDLSITPLPDVVGCDCSLSNSKISLSVPLGMDVSFLSCVNEAKPLSKAILDHLGSTTPVRYNRLLDLKGPSIKFPYKTFDVELIDSYSSRYNCNLIKKGSTTIVTINYNKILAYMLSQYYLSDRSDRDIYLVYYHSAVSMVDHMQSEMEKIDDWKPFDLFLPSIHMYGNHDHTDAYYFMLSKILDPDGASSMRPSNAYPKAPECNTDKPFTASDSEFYSGIDGKRNDKLEHLNHAYLISGIEKLSSK